ETVFKEKLPNLKEVILPMDQMEGELNLKFLNSCVLRVFHLDIKLADNANLDPSTLASQPKIEELGLKMTGQHAEIIIKKLDCTSNLKRLKLDISGYDTIKNLAEIINQAEKLERFSLVLEPYKKNVD